MIDIMAISDALSATSSVPTPYTTTSVLSVDPTAINPTAPTRKRWRDDVCDFDDQDDDVNYASKSPSTLLPPTSHPLLLPSVVSAAQPIVTVLQTEGAKRPQLKYDPDVPMTREQTRAWRHDQRRKRNRESAAACRKRQRDLISVLEGEVAEWKAKFDNALSKIKERDGEGAAMELQAQIETMFVVPTSQKTTERSSCATPPPPNAHHPDEIYPMGMVHSSHVISPYDHPQFIISHHASSSYNHHELHFPVLDDHDAIAKANHWSGAASPDEFKNTTTSRVEKRQHLNEIITRPAQSRLLPLSSRRGFGGWQCRHRIDFHSFGIAYNASTQ